MKEKDFTIAVNTSTVFYNKAFDVFQNPDLMQQKTEAWVSEVIFAATNLNLALELALKSMLLALGIEPRNTHDLIKLFKMLPQHYQDAFSEAYKGCDQKLKERGISISFKKDNREQLDKISKSIHADGSLEGVLSRFPNGFVQWRYAFEISDNVLFIEYDPLLLFCNIIYDHINENETHFRKELAKKQTTTK